ncbi:MAG: YceI family protein [Actinotalea sp.]|nr:YceI family protein [Actinotalea sp.]
MSAPDPAAHADAAHPTLPPEHRRRWLIGTLVAVLVAVGLVVGGPWVYARFVVRDAPDPLAFSTPTPSPSTSSGAEPDETPVPIDVDGTWAVGDGSQAGYRLGEVLSGEQVTVVGRTDVLNGAFVVDGGQLTSAEVVVDTASIVTDESARDAYFRRALDTTDFPQAIFSLAAPVDVSAVGTASQAVAVEAAGTLTFHGVSNAVTASLQVRRTTAGIEVVGTVPVVLADYGLEAPDLGFVTVEPNGTVELLLVLTR